MRQCKLRRGNLYQVAWLPVQFAIHGRYLRLLDVDGWQVVEVGMYQKSVELPHGYLSGGIWQRQA